MNNVLKFFLNAIKAIFLSPFYLAVYVFYLIVFIINHLIGEFRLLFSGFQYGTDQENEYLRRLEEIKSEQAQKEAEE